MIIVAVKFRRKKEGREEAGILIEGIGADDRILDKYGKEVKVVWDSTRLYHTFVIDVAPILKAIPLNKKV